MDDDDHDHPHAAISEAERPGYFDMLETALEELLIERRLIAAGEIRGQIDVLDSRTPALGARVVARAWTDPAFRARLLADGRGACEEFGITFYDDTGLVVLENTAAVHNLVLCTLCSCYPRPVLGSSPDWYKLKPYRARAVVAPRALLAEFGTAIPDDVGGLPSAFFEHSEHELKPWEKRCHALADVLDFHKIIDTEEKRRGVEALGAEMIGKLGYYERWLTAFAVILLQKGVLTPTEFARKMQEIEGRWPAEPKQPNAAVL